MIRRTAMHRKEYVHVADERKKLLPKCVGATKKTYQTAIAYASSALAV